jgi:hypothetical protein
MIDAPRQNWRHYEARARDSDAAWIRSLTVDDRFDLYADMFGILWEAQRGRENSQLDRWNWNRKLATHLRLIDAFGKLDKRNCD